MGPQLQNPAHPHLSLDQGYDAMSARDTYFKSNSNASSVDAPRIRTPRGGVAKCMFSHDSQEYYEFAT